MATTTHLVNVHEGEIGLDTCLFGTQQPYVANRDIQTLRQEIACPTSTYQSANLTKLLEKNQTLAALEWWALAHGTDVSRAMKNTGHLLITLLIPRVELKKFEGLQARDICSDRLRRLVERSEDFPPSYNKLLLQGAAHYCARVLQKIDERESSHRDFLRRIRTFTFELESLRNQFAGQHVASFGRLDLQSVEDRFELIQTESAQLGILPRLEDIPTAELAD